MRDTLIVGESGRIWPVLPSVFESLEIDAEMMDPTSLVIGTERLLTSRVDGSLLSEFLDCGGGVAARNADSYAVTLSVFVQLERAGTDSTRVRTVFDASAQSRYNQSDRLQCASFGTLERRLVARIDQRLNAPADAVQRGPLRTPVPGDFVRLTCTRPEGPNSTSEGELLGVSEAAVSVALPGDAARTTIPLSTVTRLEIRERRSPTRLVAWVGAGVGVATGALVGRSFYDPDARSHYRAGVPTTIGAVFGTIGGALLGALVGSFIDHDSWVPGQLTVARQPDEGSALPAVTGSCPVAAPMAR